MQTGALRTWILLIYTVPAQPTRKRALVWRELKKIGAVYLRDGVAVLPEHADTLDAFRALALKIEDMSGRATVVTHARIEADHAESLISQARAARAVEYEEIAWEATALLGHLRRETRHRDFGPAELEALDADVGKLRRWIEQVRARDHFQTIQGQPARDVVEQCAGSLAVLLDRRARAQAAP